MANQLGNIGSWDAKKAIIFKLQRYPLESARESNERTERASRGHSGRQGCLAKLDEGREDGMLPM